MIELMIELVASLSLSEEVHVLDVFRRSFVKSTQYSAQCKASFTHISSLYYTKTFDLSCTKNVLTLLAITTTSSGNAFSRQLHPGGM